MSSRVAANNPQNSNATLGNTGNCFAISTFLNDYPFSGVLAFFTLHVAIFLVLVFLFCFIRKFWDHGRIAQVADPDNTQETNETDESKKEHEQGYWAWVLFNFRLTEEDVAARSGPEAIHYLSFLRHLIWLLAIMTTTSFCVVGSVNLIGNRFVKNGFGSMTVGNLAATSPLLWVHLLVGLVVMGMTVAVMRYHMNKVNERETIPNTLLIEHIPRKASEEDIKEHFMEAYPDCTVTCVTMVYDVANLIRLDQHRDRVIKHLNYYQKIRLKTGYRPMTRVRQRENMWLQSSEIDALNHYSREEQALLKKIRVKVAKAPKKHLGKAFVSLENAAMAKIVMEDCNAINFEKKGLAIFLHKPSSSSKSKHLRTHRWKVSFAPKASSVYWENWTSHKWVRTISIFVFNIGLIALLTKFTTPTIIVTTILDSDETEPEDDVTASNISEFLESVLMSALAMLLPNLVYLTRLMEPHADRSSEHKAMMTKLFLFLIIMVLFLPSLGFTSVTTFADWLFSQIFRKWVKKLRCVFQPDVGAYYVKYVIAAALTGAGLELWRLPSFILYMLRLAWVGSAAEREYVRQNIAMEAPYGVMYSMTVLMFNVVMAYSLVCPIITVFGLLYMSVRYWVAKYNLFFAYLPTALDVHVHMVPVNQALFAPIVSLTWLYLFFFIKIGVRAPIAAINALTLLVVIAIYIFYIFFGFFKYLIPSIYREREGDFEAIAEENNDVYLPKVLFPNSTVINIMEEVAANLEAEECDDPCDDSRVMELDTSSEGSLRRSLDGAEEDRGGVPASSAIANLNRAVGVNRTGLMVNAVVGANQREGTVPKAGDNARIVIGYQDVSEDTSNECPSPKTLRRQLREWCTQLVYPWWMTLYQIFNCCRAPS